MSNIDFDRNNLVYGNIFFYTARIRALRELRAQRKKWCRKNYSYSINFSCWPRNRSVFLASLSENENTCGACNFNKYNYHKAYR